MLCMQQTYLNMTVGNASLMAASAGNRLQQALLGMSPHVPQAASIMTVTRRAHAIAIIGGDSLIRTLLISPKLVCMPPI